MSINSDINARCSGFLMSELQLATGCTEPIALAYCSAAAVKLLGERPVRYDVRCSGNIVKNVKSVTVPNTGGLRGIKAAALAGAMFGDADKGLDVLGSITDEGRQALKDAMDIDNVDISVLESGHVLHIMVTVFSEQHSAMVEIADTHTGIIRTEKDGVEQFASQPDKTSGNDDMASDITIEDIFSFADNLSSPEILSLLRRQVEVNRLIAAEGIKGGWGEAVGKTLLDSSDSIYVRMQAMAAAGSDARMNGCAMPVVVNCGSGNQGITSSIPLVEYASYRGADEMKLLRAVAVSDLSALRQKCVIGRLSAYCGAVAAAAGCAAGMAYIDGMGADIAGSAIVNTIATIGGMVCDGAKSSCASKIAAAINCAQMGYEMAKNGRVFRGGDGLVKNDAESTMDSVGRMAAKGMTGTDSEILRIMMED